MVKSLTSRVLLTSLSPRPLTRNAVEQDIFWTRYSQLDRLLTAAQELRRRLREVEKGEDQKNEHLQSPRILPLVVIDSLNMFAMRELEREELYRLFSLFKRHETIGVFVVETSHAPLFDSTLADVVISLFMEEDEGYLVRYIEVTKSRYQHQVYGRHPFKTMPLAGRNDETPPIPGKHLGTPGDRPRHGVVVFPSLHYVVLRTEKKKPKRPEEADTAEAAPAASHDRTASSNGDVDRPANLGHEGKP